MIRYVLQKIPTVKFYLNITFLLRLQYTWSINVADLAVIQVGININRRKLFTNNISTYFEVVSWVLNLVKSILKSTAIMQGKRTLYG